MKKETEYVVIKPITLMPGLLLKQAAKRIEHIEPHYELLIGIGKDHVASMIVSQETILAHPKLFVRIAPCMEINDDQS